MKAESTFRRIPIGEVTRDLVAVAMGRMPADLMIINGRLVNVNIGQIQPDMDVVVKHGYVVYIGKDALSKIQRDDRTVVVDAAGRWVAPGLIDSHVHIESSMVDPVHFAAGCLAHGTTTICPDNHEITNVLGLEAVRLFHDVLKDLPIKSFLAMPVCVPAVAGLENTGAEIHGKEVAEAYQKGWAQLQGEEMNFPGVIYGDPGTHEILKASHDAGVVMTGHYSSMELDQGLNAFAAAGMNACHEVRSAEEVLKRSEIGFYSQLRYGSAWLDVPNTIRAYTDNPNADTRFLTLCTDDVNAATIAREGQMDRCVRVAIRNGVPPVTAIQMATLNNAQLIEKARRIGSIAPGRSADILILSDLVNFKVDQVYSDGVLVAENGKMTVELTPYSYPEAALKTMKLNPRKKSDFAIPAPSNDPQKIRVIEIRPGDVVAKELQLIVEPKDGFFVADADNDIAKGVIFYRHEPDPSIPPRGAGFIRGTKFRPGCAYASTISHDCHNLLVVGTDDDAMTLAANAVIEANGGIAIVVDGKIDAVLPLPLAGLMSLESIGETALKLNAIEKALGKAGAVSESIEMTMSLIGLIVIPELRISNHGLVELKGSNPLKLVDLVVTD